MPMVDCDFFLAPWSYIKRCCSHLQGTKGLCWLFQTHCDRLNHRDGLFLLLLSVSCRFHLTEPESGSFQLALGSAYTGSSISPGVHKYPFKLNFSFAVLSFKVIAICSL